MSVLCRKCGAPIDHKSDPKKRPYCKKCRNAMERAAYNPKQDRNRQLKLLYGIDQKEHDRMVLEQGGMCWLCERDNVRLVVDHNHMTGKVRKLLCFRCNNLVGYAENTPELLAKVHQYLKDHS